ncbi:MAG: type I 3-dehydroquinate dehydratase [Phycisphaeraceae bacterium]|nr:type I 3-dehydroquinate dehydratase [Phycisphaeraceae bacterium]
MTALTAAIMVRSLEQALAEAAIAAENGADLIELRIDGFTDDLKQLATLVQRCPLPCIITCRSAEEGGEFDGDEQTRIAALEHAAIGPRQPAYIDLELATHQRSANLRQKIALIVQHDDQQRPVDTRLILSAHDFRGRPNDLLQKFEAMAKTPHCRIIKVAWLARSLRDNIEAFELIEQRCKPTIALCMGEFGLPSRVLAKKFDALLTFAAVKDGLGTAIGQPTIHELKKLYRWDAIQRDTKVYGVIGDPVGHSRSPHIHNAGFTATGYNGVYLPLRIPPEYEHFKATAGAWLDYKPLDFRGASVTIPHKHNLLKFVKECGGEVEQLSDRIGAANTLAVREDGSLYACNTDYAAALDVVCAKMEIAREQLRGKRVFVFGAGGVGRAVVAGYSHYGAQIRLSDIDAARVAQLAEEFAGPQYQVKPAASADLRSEPADIIINCSPLGMHPHEQSCAIEQWPDWAGENTVVFDMVYNPLLTRLLREAAARGCATVSGLEMFLHQAAAQFKLWTNLPAPLDVFRKAMG